MRLVLFVYGIPCHSGDGSCCIGTWSKFVDNNIKNYPLLNMMVLFFFLSPFLLCVFVVAPVCFKDYQFVMNQNLHFSINEKI